MSFEPVAAGWKAQTNPLTYLTGIQTRIVGPEGGCAVHWTTTAAQYLNLFAWICFTQTRHFKFWQFENIER